MNKYGKRYIISAGIFGFLMSAAGSNIFTWPFWIGITYGIFCNWFGFKEGRESL
jgi:hypothetical protein